MVGPLIAPYGRDARFGFFQNPNDLALAELRLPHNRSCEPGAVYLRVSTEGGSLRLREATGRGKQYSHPRTLKPTATQDGRTSIPEDVMDLART